MKLQRPDPGIDAAKSGLHGKAGIFFNAGLLEKGEPRFDLQDLDPYLVFDSRESMLGTLENPTLDLDPATPSTLDVITATRAGIATYTDPDGNIATASADTVRVDYTQGAELTPTKFQHVGYTDFSSGWATYLGTATLGDGYDSQASLVCSFTGTGQSYQEFQSVDGRTYTGSVWARAVSASGPYRLFHGNSASGLSTYINLTSEWQFFSVQFLGRSGGGTMYFGIGAQNGDQVEISQPQVEEGTTASDFVANTTGSPKFITGATYGPRVPMILVEPSATNKIRWSESSSAYSYGTGMTAESSDVLAPNGQASAFKMTPNDTSTTHRWGVSSRGGSWNANDVITYSVWIKTDGYDYIINLGGFFGGEAATFDTLDGSLIGNESNVISGSSEDYGNGWFRYVVTYTFQNAITNNYVYSGIRLYKRDASGNATNWDATGETTGVLVYGSQFELGSVATSYIPTDNDVSGVTRAADNLVISGSAFSDFYNASEGTIYVEAVGRGYFDNNTTFALTLGNSSNNSIYQRTPSNSQVLVVVDSNNVQAQMFSATASTGTLVRRAGSFKLNDFKSSQDGVDITPDTSGTIPTIDRLRVGASPTGLNQLNGHIKRLIYWPYHSDSL